MRPPLCDDKSLLIAYLYGECDPTERRVVEDHLAECARCADEIAGLRGVQATMRHWTPPEQALGFRMVREDEPSRPGGARVLGWRKPGGGLRVPAWAQAIAAVLVLAVAAAIANLDVRIGNGGVTIQTGWQKAGAAQARTQPAAPAAPWRADFAALERRLREDLAPAASARVVSNPVPPPAARVSRDEGAALLRRVQALIDDSERRQQQEVDRQVAERILRLSRDVSAQRVSDLRTIQQNIGQMDVRTNELRRVQNYLLRNANVTEIK